MGVTSIQYSRPANPYAIKPRHSFERAIAPGIGSRGLQTYAAKLKYINHFYMFA